MSVSIHDMEMTATDFPDLGATTIELSDLNDDVRMNLLSNPKYSGGGGGNTTVQVSQPSFGTPMDIGISGGIEEIDVSKMETIQPIELDFNTPTPAPSVSVQREMSSFEPVNSMGPGQSYANPMSSTASSGPTEGA
jgi:hypothetical protein